MSDTPRTDWNEVGPKLLEAARALLRARGSSNEVAGYDDDGHPLNAEGVAAKKLADLIGSSNT